MGINYESIAMGQAVSEHDETANAKRILPVGTSGVAINPATEEKQDAIVTAVQNITIPAPEGGATEVNQETLISLIQTLQETNHRLSFLAGMANGGAPALRTIPIASVSTAVTGTVTATVTNFGTGIPASEMAHDMNNMTAVLANINNANA